MFTFMLFKRCTTMTISVHAEYNSMQSMCGVSFGCLAADNCDITIAHKEIMFMLNRTLAGAVI